MLSGIFKNKKLLLIGGGMLLFLMAYQFAFKKTIEAVKLNSQLKQDQKTDKYLQYNPDYSNRKNKVLDEIINTYKVDSIKYQDQFWISVSDVLSDKNIGLIYTSTTPAEQENHSNILRKNIKLKGNFLVLTALLDSLESRKSIGNVSSLIMRKERVGEGDRILLQVHFAAIPK